MDTQEEAAAEAVPPPAIPRPPATMERPFVNPTRVVPAGSEPAAPRPAFRQETVRESEGPRVHIGVVEVVVAAPAETRAPAAAPAAPSNLASRRYLRSL